MTSSSESILISGAGPTGLVLAIALLQHGVSVRLIDKLSSFRVGFKGSGIQPRSLELYNILGLLPDVMSLVGTRMPLRKIYSSNGEERVREFIKTTENTPDRPYNNPVMFAQDRHEAFLRNHLEKTYGCTVELDTELVSFEQNALGVTAHLRRTDPTTGQNTDEVFDTPYLVGCEGAHSLVRKALGLTFIGGQQIEETFVGGDIWVKSPLDPDFWHAWGDRETKGIAMRSFETRDGRFNVMCGGPDIDVAATCASREGFIKTFQQISGRTDVEFGDLIWLGSFRPSVRTVNKFSEGRVFVAGDAAHVHSPIGGQGLNTSIQDAFNLAWKLALVCKGQASAALLDSYSAERLPVVAAMLDKTTEITKSTRFAMLKDAELPGAERGFELRQFGVNVRGSAILVDDFAVSDASIDAYRSGEDLAVLAGDRAPDAPGLKCANGDDTTLFKQFGATFHTVLAFGEGCAFDASKYAVGLIKVMIILPEGSVTASGTYFDEGGYAFKHYDVRRGVKYAAIRPDGAIGALTKSADALTKYFRTILVC